MFRWLFGKREEPQPVVDLPLDNDLDAQSQYEEPPEYADDEHGEAPSPYTPPPTPLFETPPPGTEGIWVQPGHPAYERQQAMLKAAREASEMVQLEPPGHTEQREGRRENANPNLIVEAHLFTPAEFAAHVASTSLFPNDLTRPPHGRELRGIEVVLYRHYLVSIPEEDRAKLYQQGQAEGMVVKDVHRQHVELGGMEAVRIMAYALTMQALEHTRNKPQGETVERERSDDCPS